MTGFVNVEADGDAICVATADGDEPSVPEIEADGDDSCVATAEGEDSALADVRCGVALATAPEHAATAEPSTNVAMARGTPLGTPRSPTRLNLHACWIAWLRPSGAARGAHSESRCGPGQ